MQLTTDGIILRDYKIEEDRILTILTESLGVVTAFANGANRMRSSLASSTELLCHSSLVLFHHRDKYVVDKADAHRTFFGIRGDLDKLALGSYFAELMRELAPQGEEASAYMKLLLGSLHYLENGKRDPGLLKAVYELRLLTLAGYMPSLVGCKRCQQYEAEGWQFYPLHGELVCGGCRIANDPPGVPISQGVLAAMRHITYSELPKLFSFSLSDAGLKQLSRVSEDYLKYQVEKTFPTLEFLHSLQG